MAAETWRTERPRRMRRVSSADHVAAHIRQGIISGQFARGERIRQDDIAVELGLSRIPIREAVIALDREGWVRFEANKGATVASLGADDVRDHYELRGLVFGLIARQVVIKATTDDIDGLTRRHRAMKDASDTAGFDAANARFLSRMLAVADSPRLIAALLVTPSIIPTGFFDMVPDGRAVQTTGTAAVLRAIRNRDEATADRSIRDLLAKHGRAVLAVFAEADLLDTP